MVPYGVHRCSREPFGRVAVWVIVHVYMGLAIAAVTPAPRWAIALIVVASHVLIDLVPHWDYTFTRKIVLWGSADFLASLASLIVFFVVLDAPLWMLAMGILSGAPDFDVLVSGLRGDDARHWFPSHWRRFPHGQCAALPGVTIQLALVAVCAAVFVAAQT
jgi:hypothetical protein